MKKMYDVSNSSNNGLWICADNENDALDIAIKVGHIKKRKCAKIYDITNDSLKDDDTNTLQPILNGNMNGTLAFSVPSYSLTEIIQGIKNHYCIGWILYEVN